MPAKLRREFERGWEEICGKSEDGAAGARG